MVKPLNLAPEGMFSADDISKIREALASAPILDETRILSEIEPVARGEHKLEGQLDGVLSRLMGFMSEDSKRPDFQGLHARWVNDEFVNVITWLNAPHAPTNTAWNHVIVRKSENVYCLFA